MKNRPGFRCIVCGHPATLHEVAKGGDRVPFGIRHHIQLPACEAHHVPFFHGVGGMERECEYFDAMHGKGAYSRAMLLVEQRNHSALAKGDDARREKLMEYLDQ